MALVRCPNCGSMISDKASVCPKCGSHTGFEHNLITCPECGEQYSIDLGVCPNCGCPSEAEVKDDYNKDSYTAIDNSEKFPEKKKSKIGLIIAVVVVIGLSIFAAFRMKASKIRSYEDKVVEAIDLMNESAYDAALLRDLTVNVWNNAIWNVRDLETDKYVYINGRFVSDFNDALYNLTTSTSFKNKVNKITSDREKLAEIVASLKPPKGYEQIHESFTNFYYEYKQITNYAIEPSGSLNSYAEETELHFKYYTELNNELKSKVNAIFKYWSYS